MIRWLCALREEYNIEYIADDALFSPMLQIVCYFITEKTKLFVLHEKI